MYNKKQNEMREIEKCKHLKNLEIFSPKRKYNKPRYATEIKPTERIFINANGILLDIHNERDVSIFLRLK